MTQHLPILQVIVPLMAAPACLLLHRWRVMVWLLALLASATAFLISISMLREVLHSGTLIYELGGWPAPWGIEYRIDRLSAYVLLLVSGISTVALLSARASIETEIPADKHSLFYVAWLLCLAGMLGITATADVFNVFVFLEISSLSAYTLIAMGSDRRALWASYQYLIMGTVGATFILIAIGLLYAMTGTLNMADLAQRLPGVAQSRTVFTAFAFFIVGVCLKLALFPLHMWLPNAYTYSPSIVSAFLAATATKVAVYMLIRFEFSVFGLPFSLSAVPLQSVFLVLGLAGVFYASIKAIYQVNAKRLFAYSSVAQIGYMIIGLGFVSVTGLMATLLHLFNHALMKGALFIALGAVMYRVGVVDIARFQGLGRQMPFTMAAVVIGGLSLIGVPLTVGFVSKWYLVLSAIESGLWIIAVLILIGSLLAAVYVWRLVEAAYFRKANPAMEKIREAPLALLVPTWILVIANIYFGIDTRLTVEVSRLAAQSLFEVIP